MADYAAVFDGVAGKAEFGEVQFSDNTDVQVKLKFLSNQTGGIISNGGTGHYFRYSGGSLRFRSSNTNYSTWPFTPVLSQEYVFDVECRIGSVELFIDTVSQGVKSGSFGNWIVNTIAMYASSSFSHVVINRITITDNNTPSNSRDWFNDQSAGPSVNWKDQSVNAADATLTDTATDGSQWELIGGGGGVTVTGTTPSFNYSSIAASIDLTGSIDITGQTANYTYSAVNGAVDLAGDISITGATASYNYQSINGLVDLTGEITVIGATPNQSYSSVSGIIELGAVISVVGGTPNYNYQGIAGEVSLNGEILVSGETPSYSYSAIKGFVSTGEAQVIGTVTSSFASDVYSSGFKPSTITVNFKS